ncbi:hypothetical protein CEUSTIGMA_g10552.t1 [Chlamydomonas eustigma]|uniref:Uncharacterized protein n=1 Tax=Chlamydomonas eustigma TaxID=1157962 RepID=A0A250XJC8_9CHLO|nr:hypothetical protein CEUSTIGMA_g10552.t1 [Chlamydomonas eustigma]|eukprot:GAX83126.1 hypothetical protein CEUSTIGMA_g10552.t1 [Chlamydomonas eustigma]
MAFMIYKCLGLICSIVGAVIAAIGMNRGWAYGSAEPTPQWGAFKPGLTVHLDLGWWNVTSVIDSQYYPGTAEMATNTGQDFGAFIIAVISISACYSMVIIFHAVSSELSSYHPSCLPGDSALSYTSAGVGALVLLASVSLYAGLAIGAHGEVKKQFEAKSMVAELWPLPSWAFAGALVSGVGHLIAAWMLQVSASAESPTEWGGGMAAYRTVGYKSTL